MKRLDKMGKPKSCQNRRQVPLEQVKGKKDRRTSP